MASSTSLPQSPPTVEAVRILEWCRTTDENVVPKAYVSSLASYLFHGTVLCSRPHEWHWFCSTPQKRKDVQDAALYPIEPADPAVLRDVAAYLIILHAYNASIEVQMWKDSLEELLRRCTACTEGYERAKLELEDRYLNRYPSAAISSFFSTASTWESAMIRKSPPPPAAPLVRLSRLPRSLVHLILLSPSLTLDPEILALFEQSALFQADSTDLDVHLDAKYPVVGEGLLELLLLDPPPSPTSPAPITTPADDAEDIKPPPPYPHQQIRALAHMLLPQPKSISLDRLPQTLPAIDRLLALVSATGTAEDKLKLGWELLDLVLGRLMDDAVVALVRGQVGAAGRIRSDRWLDDMCGGRSRYERIVTLITGRLGERVSWFPHILNCFIGLLTPTLHLFWRPAASSSSPNPPHPLVTFDILKDNSVLLSSLDGTAKPYQWFLVFLRSLSPPDKDPEGIDDLEIVEDNFGAGLKKMIHFLSEGMQHPRFEIAVRVRAMLESLRLLSFAQKASFSDAAMSPRRRALQVVFEIYASTFCSIAFASKDHKDVAWTKVRPPMRQILSLAFDADAHALRSAVGRLGRLIARKPGDATRPSGPPTFIFLTSLWGKAFDAVGSQDGEGLSILVRAVSRFSHIDVLDTSCQAGWDFSSLATSPERKACRLVASQLNEALLLAREALPTLLERFANLNDSKTLLCFWQASGVTSAGVSLVLSPIESIHDATQALIQQSFSDVEDRADCFRALLVHSPDQALEGLIAFLSSFVDAASAFPEACAIAKWMVRCLTDVIDVLCRSPRGLLRDMSFLNHEGGNVRRLVPKLWRLMTESIALVFDRTPRWAPFYDNEVMVDWMRDALIFARLLVNETRTFESAAIGGGDATTSAAPTSLYPIFAASSSQPPKSPAKVSTIGKEMIGSLQQVLRDLIAWLRLTDVETLHQTYELIKTLLERFSRSKIIPEEKARQKLNNFVIRAKAHRTKLDDVQLAEFSRLLGEWEEDDNDDVQIIEGRSSRPTSSLSAAKDPRTAEKNAWAKIMSGSPSSKSGKAAVARSSAAKGSSVASSPAPSSDRDEFDDEFPEFSESELAQFDLDGTSSKKISSSASKSLGRPSPSISSSLQVKPGIKSSTTSRSSSGSVFPRTTGFPSSTSSSLSSRPSGSSKPTTTSSSAKSSSSGKSGLLRQLRNEHKAELPKLVGKQPLPKAGLKSGFSLGGNRLGASTAANSGVVLERPAPANKRRTDTQDSDATDSSQGGSDSDSEAEGGALAAFASSGLKKPVAAAAKPKLPPIARTIKMMPEAQAIKTPAQIRAEQREQAQRTRMRLKPDLEVLHRIILQWDPKSEAAVPPNMDDGKLRKIPATFESATHYLDVLEPLLMLECWSQVQKALEDSRSADKLMCEVAGKALTDDWVDVEVSVPSNELPRNYYLSDVDVVRFDQVGGGGASFFAKVIQYKRGFGGGGANVGDVQVSFRFHNSQSLHGLADRSKWQFQKVLNLSTMHREFAGLKGLPYYDQMLQPVLNASSSPLVEPTASSVERAMKAYSVNEPQAKAILGAMSPNASGFVLIQGPPGTGKTKTIGGLVGKFLSDRPSPTTAIHAPGSKPPLKALQNDADPVKKILICAPSNAAIDEVTKRLKEGVLSSSGQLIRPKIVRIGGMESINIAVKDVSLDELVDQKLQGSSALNSTDGAADLARIRAELDAIRTAKDQKLAEIQKATDPTTRQQLEEETRKLSHKRHTLTHQLNKAKDESKDRNRSLDAARRKARQDVVFEADIICSTLSGAGHDLLSSFNFETVIIDEAAQAVELSALIPLKYQCKRCIMVGDPNQLPPTVISTVATKFGYSESMFVRIQQRAPHNVHLLSIQYRMHPDISVLPSRVFYDGRLADGPEMAKKTAQVWHASPMLGPYRFFNVNSSREVQAFGHSLKNPIEADVAVALYESLRSQYTGVDFDYRIGVVTMYKEQKSELQRKFRARYGMDIVSRIDFNTVDGFQGQEKDIIILSCVRAGAPGSNAGVGFLKDSRRMNVALTRARSSLFIIGHAPTLEGGGPQWKGIVDDARTRNALVDYRPGVFGVSAPPLIQLPPAKSREPAGLLPTPLPPTSAPPPLPPTSFQTPKEIAQAKAARKDEKRRRAGSPPPAGSRLKKEDEDDGMRKKKKRKSDIEGASSTIKSSRKAAVGGSSDWIDKMGAQENDDDDDDALSKLVSYKSSVPPPAATSSSSTSMKRKLDAAEASSAPPSSDAASPASSTTGLPPTGSSKLSTSRAPIKPKKEANLFMPAKKKPSKFTANGTGPTPGNMSARAMLEAQALGKPLPPK